jgi:hypothetical protein
MPINLIMSSHETDSTYCATGEDRAINSCASCNSQTILHRTSRPISHLPVAQYIPVEKMYFQSQGNLSVFTVVTAGCIHLASRVSHQNRHSTTFSLLLSVKLTLHGRVCFCLLHIQYRLSLCGSHCLN